MVDVKISEGSTFVLAVWRKRSRAIDLEPECFVDAGICCCIAALTGDPQRRLCKRDTNVLVSIDVADLERSKSSYVLERG